MHLAREGLPWYGGMSLVTVVFVVIGWWWVAVPVGVFTMFCFYFFRDPERQPESAEPVLISPADGRVLVIDEGTHILFPEGCRRLCIFMSVWDVHVNRSPSAGTIERITHRDGKFFPAWQDAAALQNEQTEYWIQSGQHRYAMVQIAGILARRIVCWMSEGDVVQRCQKIGLIQFGSRVDLYFPKNTRITVNKGDKLKAGQTPIGMFDQG